jgi:D-psicose/D-tagatose/L-ribulose 3-epimerase
MKFGINTFVWVSPCTTDAVRELAPKVKGMGFDVLEISVENPALIDVVEAKKILAENNLEGIICGAFGPDRNLASSDNKLRDNARTYIRWLIDAAHTVGSEVVCGPFYSLWARIIWRMLTRDNRNGPGRFLARKKWPITPLVKASNSLLSRSIALKQT